MSDTAPPATSARGDRIQYADPKALPSFPSHGLSPDGAAAGAAASLGWSNHKSPEPWRPDKSSSASAAAVLAKDYKVASQWEPTPSSAGSKAALLAVGSAGAALKQQSSPKPSPDPAWGNSAATQAFAAKRPAAPAPANLSSGNSAAASAFSAKKTAPTATEDRAGRASGDRSLVAAKGAMSLAQRPRAMSNPATSSRSGTSRAERERSSGAITGATAAHRTSMLAKPAPNEAGAVPVTTMTRNMFTSRPAVKIEQDEKDQNEKLHQTAVAMARQMYFHQQKMVEQAKDSHDAAETALAGAGTYVNLQDAAYKQAQERLAKMHDENLKNREFQEYYGGTVQAPKRRFSMAAKLRRRASSDGDLEDREKSEKIRQEMSIFSSKLSQVDQTRRTSDREAVLAAAQRNVKARLQGMDQKVYNETGKMGPNMLSEWELKARETAQARHETRSENRGKIDIGGGKFMTPEEIDAIAAKRMQPVLDDINEKAEAERERLMGIKMEEEARREESAKQKTREKELKDINKQMRDQEKYEEKTRKFQEKQEEKTRKEAEKAAKAEQKRQAKDDKRKAKVQTSDISAPLEASTEASADASSSSSLSGGEAGPEKADSDKVDTEKVDTEKTTPPPLDTTTGDKEEDEARPTSSGSAVTSPTSKVKGWIKNRFSRGRSVGESNKKGNFVGGAALKDMEGNESSQSLENRPSSLRDVAMAGNTRFSESKEEARKDSHGISPVSSSEDLAGESSKAAIKAPKPIADPEKRASSSPTRETRFREEIDT